MLESSAGGGASGDAIAVPGSIASPALAALGLAGLALVAALAIAGPGIRIVLGVLEVLLGGSIVLAASLSIGDPVAAVSPAVTDATGVAGSEPTASLVAEVTPTFWPTVGVIAGVILILAGVLVLATGMRWPASSRRYRGARLEQAAPARARRRRRHPIAPSTTGTNSAEATTRPTTSTRAMTRARPNRTDRLAGETPAHEGAS